MFGAGSNAAKRKTSADAWRGGCHCRKAPTRVRAQQPPRRAGLPASGSLPKREEKRCSDYSNRTQSDDTGFSLPPGKYSRLGATFRQTVGWRFSDGWPAPPAGFVNNGDSVADQAARTRGPYAETRPQFRGVLWRKRTGDCVRSSRTLP